MRAVTVGIIDKFEPSIIDIIERALPLPWSLQVSQGGDLSDHAHALRHADVAFVMAAPLPRELLSVAERLIFVQKMGAGVDRIDLDFCRTSGIGVARLAAGNATPVAEHTLSMILAAYRRLPKLDRETRMGKWAKEECRAVNRHLSGKTVGIIGFGAIGRALARLLKGFEVEIVYFDPARPSPDVEAALNVRYLDLDALIAHADVVTLHLPLTEGTRNLLDAKRIAAMKPGALLVNCARGGLVDEKALADALRNGSLFGAALDTFAEEPPSGNPLLELENTIVTPHIAGATIDNFVSVAARAVENTKLFLAGSPLPSDDVVIAAAPRFAGSRRQA